jgi:hypothetical protein
MASRNSHSRSSQYKLGDLATIPTKKDDLVTPTNTFSLKALKASKAYMLKRYAERVTENERRKQLKYDINEKITKIKSILKSVLKVPLTTYDRELLNKKLQNLTIEYNNMTQMIPFLKKTPPHNLTEDDEYRINELIKNNRVHNTTFSRFVPTEHRGLQLHREFQFPPVPTDAVVLIPKTQLPVPANIRKERNPHNHLLMFYALFIFDFLHNFFEYTKKLCKIIKTYKDREISYNRLLNTTIQK